MMRINNNMMAMNAHRYLSSASGRMSKSLEKISSGLRINSAADDAAGLAISEKMRAQISGLEQAQTNAQNGISLIQTAEGALNETHSILQRMRQLTVDASNDTNTNDDRLEIQKEVDELTVELSRISDTTEFNTEKLLNGEFDAKFHIGANSGQEMNLTIGDMSATELGVVGDAKIELTATLADGTDTTAQISGGAADGTYTIDGTDLKDSTGTIVATTSDNGITWTGNGNGAIGDDVITFEQKVDSGNIKISDDTVTGIATFDSTNHELQSGDYTFDFSEGKLLNSSGDVIATTTDNTTFTSSLDGTTTVLTLDAAATKDYSIAIGGIDVTSQSAASDAITVLDEAITDVSGERSKLGAYQNRLEHTINNLSTTTENLQASESRIRDVDVAKEMMEFTKLNILSQASQSMLAQANQAPQGVLQLLG